MPKCELIDCRFERAPVVERKKFWHLMPVKRSHTFRRLALQHGGADGKVSECVIVRAHDRSLPLRLKMFFSGNRTQKSLGGGDSKEAAQDWEAPKAVLDIQEAVANLADVLAELWPADDTARIINRVLILYNFGAAVKGGEQDRCKLLVEFVDAVLRENASRAVVKEAPLSFRQVKERWGDVAPTKPAQLTGQDAACLRSYPLPRTSSPECPCLSQRRHLPSPPSSPKPRSGSCR